MVRRNDTEREINSEEKRIKKNENKKTKEKY
jgi:hypothetical protein